MTEPNATQGFRLPPDVAVVQAPLRDDAASSPLIYLSHLPSGSLVVLDGSAALIWSEALASGPTGAMVERVAERAGVDPATIASDVATFTEALVAGGYLVRRTA